MSLLTPQIRPYSQFVSTFVSSALEKKPSAFKWPQGRLLAYRQHRITTYLHGSAARPPVLLLFGQHHQLQHRWDVSLEQKKKKNDIRVHDAANGISIPKRVIRLKRRPWNETSIPNGRRWSESDRTLRRKERVALLFLLLSWLDGAGLPPVPSHPHTPQNNMSPLRSRSRCHRLKVCPVVTACRWSVFAGGGFSFRFTSAPLSFSKRLAVWRPRAWAQCHSGCRREKPITAGDRGGTKEGTRKGIAFCVFFIRRQIIWIPAKKCRDNLNLFYLFNNLNKNNCLVE